MKQHREGNGSKYVRAKGYDELLYAITATSKSEALRTEHAVKQKSAAEKERFFEVHKDQVYQSPHLD
jgi:predicted GIY-YIG superfamily endonuclease